MKVLKNFSCNGIKKKSGEFLNSEEIEKIKDFVNKLKNDDIISGGEINDLQNAEKEIEEKNIEKPISNSSDLSLMDLDQLADLAKKMNIKFHKNSGEEKLRELIAAKK